MDQFAVFRVRGLYRIGGNLAGRVNKREEWNEGGGEKGLFQLAKHFSRARKGGGGKKVKHFGGITVALPPQRVFDDGK